MWADIRGYEGRYQVSTLGRVKSLARVRKGKSNCTVPVLERMMALRAKIEVYLRNGGLRDINGKQKLVHRLVADAFIKPLEHGEQVDHINGVHGDNRVENLRVMKTIEHARLHPLLNTPNARDPKTGTFWPKGK
jgi:hypothetical protein